MYFDENEVKNFLNILTDRFDKFTLYLDLLSKKLVKQARRHDTLKTMKNVEFKWGVKDGSEVVKLNPKIKQTGLINFTDELKHLLHGFRKLFIPIAYIMNNRLGMYEYKK
jgi:O-methyltransferase domain protein